MSAAADVIERAAAALRDARALLFTAGAGMGVDSGLPDFRGPEGFWRAYPPYRDLGLRFEDVANPRWFVDDPELAWGFYGHRLNLYRKTAPHDGFRVLRELANGRPHFVFTSNVDGAFAKAGFRDDVICECHGSIALFQCTAHPSAHGLWPARGSDRGELVDVDPATFRAKRPLPTCVKCDALARPNILMFGDGSWEPSRTEAQEAALQRWLDTQASAGGLVVVECGAGTAIPTVRRLGEALAKRGATLIRINVREPEGPSGCISIASGALSALLQIEAKWRSYTG